MNEPLGVIIPWLLPMALLIIFSAFFSGSEAALFSLQPSDRQKYAQAGASGRRITRMLDDPERLLSAVLFWNLVINMAYFGIASIVSTRLHAANTPGAALAFTLVSLLAIIFFSEMLPKSIAVQKPTVVASLVTYPLDWAIRIVGPLLPALRFSNLIARRLIWPSFKPEKELEVNDIDRAIELSTPDQAFAERERTMLRNLVELAEVRVSELMRPLSRCRVTRLPVSPEYLLEILDGDGYLYLGNHDGDSIDSTIAVRWLRPSQMDDLESAKEPPLIVPWSSSVATVFDLLRQQNRNVAAVVNEYGETIGLLTIDSILESVLRFSNENANRESEKDLVAESDAPIRVQGATTVRDLAKLLGIKPTKGRNVTVAGLVQSVTRRIPRVGDHCKWEGYRLTVCDSEQGELVIEVRKENTEGSA